MKASAWVLGLRVSGLRVLSLRLEGCARLLSLQRSNAFGWKALEWLENGLEGFRI